MKFIRGIGWCMFFMGIGMVARSIFGSQDYGDQTGGGIVGGLFGLGLAVGMNVFINLKKPETK